MKKIILSVLFLLFISQSKHIYGAELALDKDSSYNTTFENIIKKEKVTGLLETPVYDDSEKIDDYVLDRKITISTMALSDQVKQYLYEKPSSGIVFIEITYKNGSKGYGTGFMIGKDVIATAGHLLYSYSGKQLISTAKITYHYKVNGSAAHATTHAISYGISANWYLNQTYASDFGYLFLNNQTLYKKTGIFKMSTVMPTPKSTNVRVSGYTSTNHLNLYGFSPLCKDVTDNYVKIPNVTVSGQSGGPYFRKRNGYWEVVAIHSRTTSFSGLGVRITKDVYNFFDKAVNFSTIPSQYFLK